MPDQDEYRIKVSMDTASATAGGEAIIAKQAQIKAELAAATAVAQQYGVSIETAQAALAQLRTEKAQAEVMALRQAMQKSMELTRGAGESQEALRERMRSAQEAMITNAFYLHRSAEGLKDLMMGGRMASQGFMDLEFSLQRLLPPQAQMYLAAAGMVGMLIMMATRHREVAGEAKAHADAEKEAADEIKSAHETMAQEYTQGLDQMLKAQEKVNQTARDELEIIREKGRLTDAQAKLDENAAIEKLRQSFLIAQAQPGITEGEKKSLREQYDAGVKDIKEQTTINTAKAAVTEKSEDYGAQQEIVNNLVTVQARNQKMLDDQIKLQELARDLIEGEGLTIDSKDGTLKTGNSKDAIAEADAKATATQEQLALAKEALFNATHGVSTLTPKEIADIRVRIEQDQFHATNAENYANALRSASKNYNVGDETQKAVGPKLESGAEEIKKAEQDLRTMLAELLQAQQGARQAQVDQNQQQQQDAIDANANAEQERRKQRDEGVEAERTRIETEKAQAPDSKKPELEKELAQNKVDELLNKLADAIADRPNDLELQTLIFQQIQKVQAEGNIAADKDQTASTKKATEAQAAETRAAKKEDKTEVDRLRGTIEATGSKEQREALRQAMQMDKDDQAKLFQDLIVIATGHAELAKGNIQLTGTLINQVRELKRQHDANVVASKNNHL